MNTRILLIGLAMTLGCDRSPRPNAADDPQRHVGDSLYLSGHEPTRPLVTGPLFLTDVIIDGGHSGEIFASRDAACKDREARALGNLFMWSTPMDEPLEVQSHHGMRLLVPAGWTLCFKVSIGQTLLVWAGFRPWT